MLVVLVIAFSNSHSDLEKLAHSSMAPSEALAGRMVVFCIVIIFANVPLYGIVSRLWPIKGAANSVSIFEFQCYLTALFVPFALVDVLLDPLTVSWTAHGGPPWVLFVPALFGGSCGIPLYFLYQNPGLAKLNGVSSARMFWGTVFWCTALEAVLAILVLAFLFTYYIPMERSRAAKQRQLVQWTTSIERTSGEPLLVGVNNGGATALLHFLVLREKGKNTDAVRFAIRNRSAFLDMALQYTATAKTIRSKALPPVLNGGDAERAIAVRDHYAESCEENAIAYSSLLKVDTDNLRIALDAFDIHLSRSHLLQNRARQEEKALLEGR